MAAIDPDAPVQTPDPNAKPTPPAPMPGDQPAAQPAQAQPAQAMPTDADGNAMPVAPAAQPAARAQAAAPAAQSQTTPAPGGQAVASSEAPPAAGRPPIDPRYYKQLEVEHPDVYGVVTDAAKQFGMQPQTVAAHMFLENGFKMADAPDSPKGAIGPMQVLPSTAAEINQHFGTHLDVRNPVDNVALGAGYIKMMEDKFGEGTTLSTFAYQSGPANADKVAANPALLSQFPEGQKYTNTAHGIDVPPAAYAQGPSNMTGNGVVQSALKGGPQGMLSYIAQTAPQGMPLSDAWQHADALTVNAFLLRGDAAGAEHAHNLISSMAHQGSTQNLMGAYQSLNAGDGVTAAQSLARAHAFFPDGTMGTFGVDGAGNVWGQRMDEHNPGKPMGQPFQVTKEGIAGMLNQTADPQQFLKTLREQQLQVAQTRLAEQHGDYYSTLNPTKLQVAETNAGARTGAAGINAESRVDAAQIRADARNGLGPAAGLNAAANKEAAGLYGSDAMPDVPIQTRAQMASIHQDARLHGGDPVTAEYAARGLSAGTLKLQQQSDGTFGVVDPKRPGAAIATIGPGLAHRLAGGKGIDATQVKPGSPVGSAPPMAAIASGTQQNLAGATQQQGAPQQSSGVPLQPGQ